MNPPFKPKKLIPLPNWSLAVILGGFVGATYYYSIAGVGKTDAGLELELEAARQIKSDSKS